MQKLKCYSLFLLGKLESALAKEYLQVLEQIKIKANASVDSDMIETSIASLEHLLNEWIYLDRDSQANKYAFQKMLVSSMNATLEFHI